MLRMEEVTIPSNLVFNGNDYLQYAGGEWHGKNCLRYHIYLIAEEVQLKDGTAFA